MQDANRSFEFFDVPLTSHHSHIKKVLSVGGNLHNNYIETLSTVAIFDALEEKEQKLCHVGDYVV